jgi:hypothetical protein
MYSFWNGDLGSPQDVTQLLVIIEKIRDYVLETHLPKVRMYIKKWEDALPPPETEPKSSGKKKASGARPSPSRTSTGRSSRSATAQDRNPEPPTPTPSSRRRPAKYEAEASEELGGSGHRRKDSSSSECSTLEDNAGCVVVDVDVERALEKVTVQLSSTMPGLADPFVRKDKYRMPGGWQES